MEIEYKKKYYANACGIKRQRSGCSKYHWRIDKALLYCEKCSDPVNALLEQVFAGLRRANNDDMGYEMQDSMRIFGLG